MSHHQLALDIIPFLAGDAAARRPHASASRIATVTTLRATAEEIAPFVNYHLNTGVEHMFLFFDDPTDGTAEIFAANFRVSAICCTPEYWVELAKHHANGPLPFDGTKPQSIEERQYLNATLGFDVARAQGYSWVGHIDIDELVYAPRGLTSALQAAAGAVDFVRFPVLEAIARDVAGTVPTRSAEYFKVAELPPSKGSFKPTSGTRVRVQLNKLSYRLKVAALRLTPAQSLLHDGSLVIAHERGKSFIRTSSKISYIRCHTPVPEKGSTLRFAFARDGYLLHFDCCTFDQWYLKWIRRCDGTGTMGTMGPRMRRRLERFQPLYERRATEEIRALYREQSIVPARALSVLQRLRLVKRVQLPDALFSGTEAAQAVGT